MHQIYILRSLVPETLTRVQTDRLGNASMYNNLRGCMGLVNTNNEIELFRVYEEKYNKVGSIESFY